MGNDCFRPKIYETDAEKNSATRRDARRARPRIPAPQPPPPTQTLPPHQLLALQISDADNLCNRPPECPTAMAHARTAASDVARVRVPRRQPAPLGAALETALPAQLTCRFIVTHRGCTTTQTFAIGKPQRPPKLTRPGDSAPTGHLCQPRRYAFTERVPSPRVPRRPPNDSHNQAPHVEAGLGRGRTRQLRPGAGPRPRAARHSKSRW